MIATVITIHLLLALAMIGSILLQPSEGGALGIGSSSGGNFLSGRGQATLLTRTTTVLAVAFFSTSILLTILSQEGSPSIAQELEKEIEQELEQEQEDQTGVPIQ